MLSDVKTAMGRHLPWWLVLAIGAGCVVLGGVLIADPFRSLTVLAWLVAAALVVSGLGELVSSATASRSWWSRFVGIVWIAAGVLAVAWPGLTIRALAITVGIALVVGGAIKLLSALFSGGDERLIHGLGGLTTVVAGILALSWPDASVLVLAVLFGVGTAVFGFGQIAVGLKLRGGADEPWESRRRWPRPLRLIGAVVAFVLALGGMAISVAIDRAGPADPGAFYAAPSPLPAGPPGTIVRSEVVDGFYEGATTYRVLYTSTGYDGRPTAVSGLVVVPDGAAPASGRKVIAFTHGTTGVASNCAPSLQDPPVLAAMEGLPEFVAAGYVVAASDYQGLGTPGPHPYLVGASEGMNEFDAVRAARNLPETQCRRRFRRLGPLAGRPCIAFHGQLAASYAPELRLHGVAAGAPVPNLVDLFEVNIETTVGKS